MSTGAGCCKIVGMLFLRTVAQRRPDSCMDMLIRQVIKHLTCFSAGCVILNINMFYRPGEASCHGINAASRQLGRIMDRDPTSLESMAKGITDNGSGMTVQ